MAVGRQAGPVGLLARAVLQGRVTRAAIDTGGFDFLQVHRFDDPMFLPAILRYGGLDGLWQVASQSETVKVDGAEKAVAAIAAAGEADSKPK